MSQEIFLTHLNGILANCIYCDLQTKYRIFVSYYTSYYGSCLWDLQHKLVDVFYTTWRKAIIRLFGLPRNAHCNLLPLVAACLPILGQLLNRCANFVNSYLNSNNCILKLLSSLALQGSVSQMANNCNLIKYVYRINSNDTRSICNKVSVVAETIIDADADVSFLTETWLRSNHQDIVNVITLPGFELKHLNRLGKRCGGLCVLHRNSLKFVRTAAVTPTHFELLQLSCSKPCYHFALINIQATSIQRSRFSRRIRGAGEFTSYYPGKTADPR